MKTHKFARKPFYVDAVRVSETNIEEVAAWCEGEIKTDPEGKKYIHIKGVYRPLNEKQTQAFVGDWVLLAGTGFKVYVPKAFDKSFEKVKHLSKSQADEAGIKPPHEQHTPVSIYKNQKIERDAVKSDKPIPTPSIMNKKDRVTGEDATVFTPPEDLIEANQPVAEETATTPVKQKDEVDELFEEVLRHDNSRA